MAKQKDIQSRIITAKISDLKENPDNPRTITADALEKLKASIREFPAMLQLRPIVVDADMVVLGGNMRLKACKELGITDVPIIRADTLTDKEKERFIIADNVAFGEWDFEALANDWDVDELEAWGVDDVEWGEKEIGIDEIQTSDSFSLPEGDKAPFQQMTFTLADAQAEVIKNALADIKKTDEYKFAETHGNENSNGNALYLIVATWAGQRK